MNGVLVQGGAGERQERQSQFVESALLISLHQLEGFECGQKAGRRGLPQTNVPRYL